MKQTLPWSILSLSPTNIPFAARAMSAFSLNPTFFRVSICLERCSTSAAVTASLYLPS